MLGVLRYDRGSIGPVRMDNGYLRTEGRITRVGVFNYRRADGTVQKELRLPEEVFKADSLKTFHKVPLTNGHPPERLTSSNTSRYQRGDVSDPRRDGDFIVADIQVTDADAIKDAEGGKAELSNGYTCDIEDTSGTHPQFGRYDVIQRGIRGNHVALVTRARGGHDLTIRLDGDDAQMVPEGTPAPTPPGPPSPRSDTMKTIRIDGVDYPAEDQLIQAVTKLLTRSTEHADELKTAKADVSKEKARADAAEESLETEKKARADESSPEKVQGRVDARVELQTTAATILGEKKADGSEWKLDAMSDAEIKTAVVLKASPGAQEKLDAAVTAGDANYLSNRFDQVVDSAAKTPAVRSDGLAGVRGAANVSNPDQARTDSATARQNMIDANRKRGVEPFASQAGTSQ